MAIDDVERLVRAYGVQLDGRDLRALLADEQRGAEAAEWIAANLGPDTLLTRDELSRYAHLQKSGEADRLLQQYQQSAPTGDGGGSGGGPTLLTDADLQAAIAELTRSTSALSRQTETLAAQADALARLAAASRKAGAARAELEAAVAAGRAAERRALGAEVDDEAGALAGAAAEAEAAAAGLGAGAQRVVEGVLDADDRVLAGLRKLGSAVEREAGVGRGVGVVVVEGEDGEGRDGARGAAAEEEDAHDDDEAELKALREACARLIKANVELVRTQLDRLFLEALQQQQQQQQRSTTTAAAPSREDMAALEDELESLYAEILPVAQMAAEQQYLGPAVRSLAARNGATRARAARALEYMDAVLTHLLHQTTLLSARIDRLQSHRAATSAVVSAARAELAAPVEDPLSSAATGSGAAPPLVRRGSKTSTSQGGATTAATTAQLHRRRKSSSANSLVGIGSPSAGASTAFPAGPPGGPVRRRSSTALSIVSAVGAADELQTAPALLEQLLRHVAVPPPDELLAAVSIAALAAAAGPPSSGSTLAQQPLPGLSPPQQLALHRQLTDALGSRTARAAEVGRAAQAALEEGAAARMADAKKAVAAVRAEVLGDNNAVGLGVGAGMMWNEGGPEVGRSSSAGGDDRAAAVGSALVDADLEESVAVLAQEADRVAAAVDTARTEVAVAARRAAGSEARLQFVQRWRG